MKVEVIKKNLVEVSDFVNFLKDIDATGKWRDAILENFDITDKSGTVEGIFKDKAFLGNGCLTWDDLINGTFAWGSTCQGVAYWSLVDMFWKRFLTEHNVDNRFESIKD